MLIVHMYNTIKLVFENVTETFIQKKIELIVGLVVELTTF